MLTEAQKKIYYELAIQIQKGQHKPVKVFEAFEEFPDEASEIVNFWLMQDEFTQNVVHYLAIEKCRLLYERCYRKEIDKWTLTKRKLMLILNGLKQILFGVRDSLTGAEPTQKKNGNNLHF